MKIYRETDKYEFAERRKKNIIIEDSYVQYLNYFEKVSKLISPKHPLVQDTKVIDYDMLSEDEWNE